MNSRYGLTLIECVITAIACAVLFAAVVHFGARAVLNFGAGLLMFGAAAAMWGWSCRRSYHLTMNLTVLGLVGFVFAAVVPGMVQSAREAARRHQSRNNLRMIGARIVDLSELHSGAGPDQMSQQAQSTMRQEFPAAFAWQSACGDESQPAD